MLQLCNNASKWLLIGIVATMLSLLAAPLSTPAQAAALGATITAGSTTSTDDNVPSGGTTLDVPTMLSNAGTAAVFSALRLTFLGTLKITLPATEAAWTCPPPQ